MSAHSEAANGFVLSEKVTLMLNTMTHESRTRVIGRAYELFAGLEDDSDVLEPREETAAKAIKNFAVDISKSLRRRQEQSKNARKLGEERRASENRENISRTSHDNLTTSQEESEEEKSSPTPSSKEEAKEEDLHKARVRKVFTPPSVEEVTAYCTERHNGINASDFVDFYTGKGWMIGKNKMVDWKAAVRTWERNRSNANRSDSGLGYGQSGSGHQFRSVTAGNFRSGTEAQRAEANSVL